MKTVVYSGDADRFRVAPDVYLYRNQPTQLQLPLAEVALGHIDIQDITPEANEPIATTGGEENNE